MSVLRPGTCLASRALTSTDLEAALVENLEDWNPVDSRGLHSDRANAAVLKPVRQPVQIASERAETAHRFGILFRSHRCYVHRSANVNSRCALVGGRNVPPGAGRLWSGHATSSCINGGAGLCKEINFLTGITARVSPLSSTRSSPWTTLCNGVGHHQIADGRSPPGSVLARIVSTPAGGPRARERLCSSRHQ